jgi:hypothetical protein
MQGRGGGLMTFVSVEAKRQAIKKAKSEDFAFLAVTSATFAANKLSNIR